jgi:hypothetical protein
MTAAGGGKYRSRVINCLGVIMLLVDLSSCAVYSSSFDCPDARGARCLMLSEVDKQIDSGEIETVYLAAKCKSKVCIQETNNIPEKALNQIRRVKIEAAEEGLEEYQDGDNLYLAR